MAWIRVIEEEDAAGTLRELYSRIIEPWGGVDNIMTIHSIEPRALEAHLHLYRQAMRESRGLSQAQREMVAVVVSKLNGCTY